MSASRSAHVWKFYRLGGLDQVALESAEDLRALGELDPKLWVALSCPVAGLEIDAKTLQAIDIDGDGHVRQPEVVAAVHWTAARLKDPGVLLNPGPALPLAAINDAALEGQAILASARWVLGRLGREKADSISPADTGDPSSIFASGVVGDGVVPADAAPDDATRALIEDMISCLGGATGKTGRIGTTKDQAAAFFEQAAAIAEAAELPTFSPYPGWTPTKFDSPLCKLGLDRIKQILSAGRGGLDALFAQDEALAAQWAALAELDHLVRLYRDLHRLLRNFVNFFNFYSREKPADFQAGTLYLDERSCTLCVRVADPAAHATLAAMSKLYIAYLDCRSGSGQTMKIAACFTQGDSDYLFVGRNGLFLDRAGRDWDAVITRIVENPISVREAFFSPYKKLLRFVEDQMLKRTAAVGDTAAADLAAGKTKLDVGTIAALGVAVGGITTAFGYIVGAIAPHRGLIPVILVAIVLMISGPSVLIAWFKLRQRNLGPILEANGWAVNGRVGINVPLGVALTGRAELPARAKRIRKDPYADRAAERQRWLFGVLIALIAAELIAARLLHTWPF
jgi:hypothetical protein